MFAFFASIMSGGWIQQALIVVVCVTIIVMMVFGSGIEINLNSKNWIRQSVRTRSNTRVREHNRGEGRRRILRSDEMGESIGN